MEGVIARLLTDKGFGFIRDNSGVEHFFHRSGVKNEAFSRLKEGLAVSFEEEQSAKGPRATNVSPMYK